MHMREPIVSGLRGAAARARAFSLVELVVTIAIIAMLAAVAIPRYGRSLDQQRVTSAARRIAADLATAQSRAKATSTSQTVSFTPQTRSYTIRLMTDPDRPSAAYVVDLAAPPYSLASLTASCGGDTDLVFTGYGIADSSGTIAVQAGEAQKTLTLNKDSGVVTIQ